MTKLTLRSWSLNTHVKVRRRVPHLVYPIRCTKDMCAIMLGARWMFHSLDMRHERNLRV